jgi:putative transcription antitermination factor YqgF
VISEAARIAEPLKTIPAETAIDDLVRLVKDAGVTGIVVGMPRNLEGAETAQTEKVRQWIQTAQKYIKVPFYWQDEALTSVISGEDNGGAGADARAASVFLQDFLDTPEDQRVRCSI